MSTFVFLIFRRLAALVLLAGLTMSGSLQAADQKLPSRPADTSSPRATLFEFIDTCNELHEIILADKFFDRTSHEHRPTAMRVVDCLDISNIPEFERMEAAGEAAICLKEILDRVDLPSLDEIPGANELEQRREDGEDPILRWRIPGTRLTIVRVEEGPQRHEYVFSAGTVDRVFEIFQDLKPFPYRETGPKTSPGFYDWYMTAPGHPVMARIVQWLPDWFRERFLGVALWKWIGMILGGAVAVALMIFSYQYYAYCVARYHQSSVARYCLTILLPVFAMLVPLLYKNYVYDFLTLRGTALYYISFAANVVVLCASMVVVFGLGTRISALILSSPRISSKGLDAQFVVIMSRLLSIVAAVIIFLEGGHYLGIPVTTLLASAGIGGLAVALAAQDTLRNLFGTIMLLMDKPFRVGERIIFGKYDGVVESIGLRSTRLRLLTGHQATVPNDELARNDIENVGRRPHIRQTAVLELPARTPVAQVRRALEIVRQALDNHKGMEADFPPRVFLRDLKEGAIGIFFIFWYHPPEYWEFLAFNEQLNLQIIEQLEAEGIRFATPVLDVRMPDNTNTAD